MSAPTAAPVCVVIGAIARRFARAGYTTGTRRRDAEVKERLKAVPQEAVLRGGSGAPAFFVGEQMFWGQDRPDFVQKA